MGNAVTGVEKIRRALELQRASTPLAAAARRAPPPALANSGPGVDGASELTPPVRTAIAPVDAKRLRRNKIIAPGDPSPAAAAYRMLRTQVLQLMHRGGFNSLAVVSPSADDGRTLTAINLAVSIADDPDHTALLVDLNLQRPEVHERFGISVGNGADTCLGTAQDVARSLVTPTGYERLVLLPSARQITGSTELLASDATRRTIREINARYTNRIVLFDLPPLLETADALAFLPCVDATLLVVREGRTRREDVVRSLQLLRDTPVVGTVLNGSREARGL